MTRQKCLYFALLLGLIWVPMAGAQQDPAETANAVVENRQKNQIEQRQYSWHTRTEIQIKGESKSIKTEMVRFTADGEMQRTVISETGGGAPTKGIKGKVAKKKIKGMKEWAAELKGLLQQYSLPTAGDVLDFMNKAATEAGPKSGTIQLVASDVVQPGDRMTMLIHGPTKNLKKIDVQTALDGDDVSLEIVRGETSDGLQHNAQQKISVPAEGLILTIENFNYQKQ